MTCLDDEKWRAPSAGVASEAGQILGGEKAQTTGYRTDMHESIASLWCCFAIAYQTNTSNPINHSLLDKT
jgi:hypothetical protein